MNILTFAVSCLTGIGALALIAIAGIGGFVCFVMWQDQHEPPTKSDMPMTWDKYTEHVGIFTHEEAIALSMVKDSFNELEERYTTGAEYDSTC